MVTEIPIVVDLLMESHQENYLVVVTQMEMEILIVVVN